MNVPYVYGIAMILFGTLFLVKTQGGITSLYCDIEKLIPCLQYGDPAVRPPTRDSECCRNIHEQEPCLCMFWRDPEFQEEFDTPGAARVARFCRITLPNAAICG